MREGTPKHIGVALLRDGCSLTTGEVGDLGVLGDRHAHQNGAGKHWTHHNIGAIVHGLFGEPFGHTRIGLGVLGLVLDFSAQDTARCIDLFDREFDAVVEIGARCGAWTGQLDQAHNFDGAGVCGPGAHAHQGCSRKGHAQCDFFEFHVSVLCLVLNEN